MVVYEFSANAWIKPGGAWGGRCKAFDVLPCIRIELYLNRSGTGGGSWVRVSFSWLMFVAVIQRRWGFIYKGETIKRKWGFFYE